jgi:ADP-ribosylglycohydrolase
MRIAPLAFLLDPVHPDHRVIIRDVCRITHHSDEAHIGALAVLLAIHSVVAGSWSPQTTFLALTRDNLPDSAVRDRIEQLAHGQFPASQVAARFGASGHVVDAVPLALYCAQSIASNNLADVLAMTITCGRDTDTIASIAGQLAGTVVGAAGVTSDLVAAIHGADNVVAAAHQFADFVCNRRRQP